MNNVNVSFFCLCLLLCSCSNTDEELKEIKVYEGPVQRAENIHMLYSQSASIKTKLDAAVMEEYENGDREFPEGIYLESYDENGKISSTIKADKAYYFKDKHLWRGRGNVEIRSLEDGRKLDTEELFWDETKKEVYTTKFVTMTDGDEILHGTGLQAAQDFSWYGFGDPSGNFNLEE